MTTGGHPPPIETLKCFVNRSAARQSAEMIMTLIELTKNGN
jgi:hypothetical protein